MPNLAGKPLNQAELNRIGGSICSDFLDLIARVRAHKLQLDQFTAADLAALPTGGAPAGYAEADGTNHKSAIGALNDLANVADGLATVTGGVVTVQAGGVDFRTFSKRLAGFSAVE